jgi:amino-acid N-acetyltransferase
MTLRPAEPEDLSAIQSLLQSLGLPHHDLTPSKLEHFLVYAEDETLCGVVGLELCGSDALLRSLAVPQKRRHEGIGARLVEAIERHAEAVGVASIYLLTTTATDYFRHFGYTPIGRDELPPAVQDTDEAASLCPSSATCMRKCIQDGVDRSQW